MENLKAYQISDNRPACAGCISCLTQLDTVLSAGQSPVSVSLLVKVVTEHEAEAVDTQYCKTDHMFEDRE